MRLIPVLTLTILLAMPTGTTINYVNASTNPREALIALAHDQAKSLKTSDLLYPATSNILIALMRHHEKVESPTICDIKMPQDQWWLVQVAAEVTGADPAFIACVLRFESDFRVGPIGHGTYVGPGGIISTYEGKFPIYDLFGNILTTARRLAMFSNMSAALAGYNKDRSAAYGRYCNSVRCWVPRVQHYPKPKQDEIWMAAVELGRKYLAQLEIRAYEYTYARRR